MWMVHLSLISLLFPLFCFVSCGRWSFAYSLLLHNSVLLIHSYWVNQSFFSLHSVLSAKCICTYVYLLSIILTSGTLQRRPYSPEMMQLQHEYITTTATIISDTRAWANGTDDTAVPREIQQHGSEKSYRRRYRNWPWSHPVMLQGKCYLSSSSCTAIYS